ILLFFASAFLSLHGWAAGIDDEAAIHDEGDEITEAHDKQQKESEQTKTRGFPLIQPFVIQSQDGASSLRLSSGAQLRIIFAGYEDEAGLRDRESELTFGRLRASILAHFFEKRLSFHGQLNLVPGFLELIDLSLSYRFHPSLVLSAGQLKIPYSLSRAQSYSTLPLVNWGQTPRWFGGERQIGLAVGNAPGAFDGFLYRVGVFHGQNSRASFSNRLARVYGEELPNPSLLTESVGYGVVHPEFAARLGYGAKDFDWWMLRDELRGPLRSFFSVSSAYDLRPIETNDATLRLAVEFLSKWKGFGFSAQYHWAWVTLSEQTAGASTPLGYHGLQAEVVYSLHPRIDLALRYGLTQISEKIRKDAQRRADAIIADAPADERESLTLHYAKSGRVIQDEELSAGVNIYLLGRLLEWQSDISYLPVKLEGERSSRETRVRTQFQVQF
ncbi:MAG: hypothetical protein MK135_11350, partial [Polyangiaceae bacterium]|nr:hypothetical protein [Polyangiaceae bacterium]